MNTKKLIEALREVLACEQDRAEARKRYEDIGGRNWESHNVHYDQLFDVAAKELQAALDVAIDSRLCAETLYELVSENLSGLGSMANQTTKINWRKFFSTLEAAKSEAEKDYGAKIEFSAEKGPTRDFKPIDFCVLVIFVMLCTI